MYVCMMYLLLILIHVAMTEHSERPFSTLDTRSRISSFQSCASGRDREFLSFGLVLRDANENFSYNLVFRGENENCFYQSRASRREREFLLSISRFETRMRISVFSLML